MDAAGDGLLYLGSLIYRKEGNSIGLERAIFDGGMYVALSGNGSALIPQIHVTDHLGSVRAIVDSSSGAPLETNNFYPYGKRWDEAASLYDQSNRYRFNGKEEQAEFGIPYIDYGARHYDPTIGRWLSVDPLAEKYSSISPYAFCGNNPVNFVDLDGRDFRKIIRRSSITISSTYYTDRQSYKSAQKAVAFWNQRNDTYVSKSGKHYNINYVLTVQITNNINKFQKGSNTYLVVDDFDSSIRSGSTKNGRNIEVLKEYSINQPNSELDSTTGAHEIGHTLGMEHSETGIMSKMQNESRTNEVTQNNLRQMLESDRGTSDLLTIIFNVINNVYERKKKN